MEGMFDGLGDALLVAGLVVFGVGIAVGIGICKGVITWPWAVGAFGVFVCIRIGIAIANWR